MTGDDAAASVIAFAVAAGIFLVALSTLFLFAQGAVPQLAVTDPLGQVQAKSLAGSILGTGSDTTWNSAAPAWTGSSTGVPGLADPSGGLSLAKLQSVQADATDPDTLTYDEARTAFGLADREDFHIRVRPLVTAQPQWPGTGFSVVYVGTPGSSEEQALQVALDPRLTPSWTVTSSMSFPAVSCVGGVDPDVIVVDSTYVGASTDASAAWLACGGTLILLPSGTPCCTGAFSSPAATDSGPLRFVDPQHPVLTTPNQLATSIHARGLNAWAAQPGFTTLIGGNAPVLQVSEAGAFGRGTVILVGLQPTSVDGTNASPGEAARLYQNLLLRHFQELYLDWGPPTTGDAAPAVVRSDICLAGSCGSVGFNLGSQRIPVELAISVFPRP